MGDDEGSDDKEKKNGEKEDEEIKEDVQEEKPKRPRRLRRLKTNQIPTEEDAVLEDKNEEDPEPPASPPAASSQVAPTKVPTPKSKAKARAAARAKAKAKAAAAKAKAKAKGGKRKGTQEDEGKETESKKDEGKGRGRGRGKGGRGKKTPRGEDQEEAPQTPQRDAVATARANAAVTFEPAIEALRETVTNDVIGCLNVCRHSPGDDWGEERKHKHAIPELNLGDDLQLSVYWTRSSVGLKKKISGKWAQVCYFSRSTPCACTNLILAKYWVTRLRVENYTLNSFF